MLETGDDMKGLDTWFTISLYVYMGTYTYISNYVCILKGIELELFSLLLLFFAYSSI